MNRVNPGYGSNRTYLYCTIVLSLFLVTTSGKNLFSSVTGSSIVGKEEVELKAKDINGNLVDLSKHRDKTVVVLFFDTMISAHKSPLAYAQVLLDKYGAQSLYVVGITGKDYISENLQGVIDYPLVLDPGGRIHESFKIANCCGGTIVVQKGRKISFRASNLVNSNTLRQLVEKAILGQITYDLPPPSSQTLLVQGHDVPELELTDTASLQTKNLKDFGNTKVIATFFSTFCGMCKSATRIRSLENLKSALEKEKKRVKIVLVLSKPYDEMDIIEWEKHMEMPFEKYIAESIFSEAEKYVTDDTIKTDPLTVLLDAGKKVLFVEKPGMAEDQVMNCIANSIKSTNKENSR